MLKQSEITLLRFIQANDGKLNFYTLDRTAWLHGGWRHLDERHVFDVTCSLIERGYVRAEKQADKLNPVYWITNVGIRALQECVESKP
jgi:hypothetical protein